MKIKFQRAYKKADPNGKIGPDGRLIVRDVTVYQVIGTEEELADYKTSMGDNFRDSEEGIPLMFTTNPVGVSGTLVKTSSGRYVPDTSAVTLAINSARQYGEKVENEIAKLIAAQLMAANVSSVVAVTAPVTKVEPIDQM